MIYFFIKLTVCVCGCYNYCYYYNIWFNYIYFLQRLCIKRTDLTFLEYKLDKKIKSTCCKTFGIITRQYCSFIYRVSQEECARFRESAPYVKVYRYNPKHLYPKLNGYGDNGQRKVWSSRGVHTLYLPADNL